MEGWITSDGNTPANVMCDQIIVVEKLQAKPGKDAVNIDYVNTVVKGGSIGLERQSVKVRNWTIHCCLHSHSGWNKSW